jgi:hypothetical protein
MMDVSIAHSDGIINRMTATANPKTYDTAASGSKILFSLSEPVFVGLMQTVTFSGEYKDAYGNTCNAISGFKPVATTDYLFNRNSAGTGTNITANLSGSAVYSTSQATFKYTNNSSYSGWITKMNARGYGIYNYSQIEATEEDEGSINEYDYQNAFLNQPYQTDLVVGKEFISKVVEYEHEPHNKLIDITFLANTDDFLMQSYLNCDVGDLIRVKDDRNGVDGLFYIQNIHSTIEFGGKIMFKWTLRAVFTLMLGLSLISCAFSNSGSATQDAICYGNLPQLVDLPEMTLSAWVYINEDASTVGDVMSGWVSGNGGFELSVAPVSKYLAMTIPYSTSGGRWITQGNVISTGAWQHIIISYNTSSLQTITPKFYVNGSELSSIITLNSAVGNVKSWNGMDFCVGNIHGEGVDVNFNKPFDGSIKDARVYDRILTDAEVASLFAGESVTDGLIFYQK